MGSGPTQVQATFRPESKGPDLDLTLSIENTDMRRMNDPRTVISTWLPETFQCIQKSKYGKARSTDM